MSLLIGIAGLHVDADAARHVADKRVAGVILFSRNYRSRGQLNELIRGLRSLRRNLLIAVDQEGGVVQRFREGFADLPPLAAIGALYERDRKAGAQACALHAWLMSHEIAACDIDLSLAPVADLGRGNLAIGSRAFSADPLLCAELTAIYVDRMHRSGMAATLKHFPGHGSVTADSHTDLVRDDRSLVELLRTDLLPFAVGVAAGAPAVMMAHITYPRVDTRPAGYSRRWIHTLLRHTLKFRGVIMGDDVSMAGASGAGGISARVAAHYQAGCDLVLACDPAAVDAALSTRITPLKLSRIKTLRARDPRWARSITASTDFGERLNQLRSLLS